MCIRITCTHRCGHKSFRDLPCRVLGTPEEVSHSINQRDENAASSCGDCTANFNTLADRSAVYLSACQRSLVPLLQRMQFIKTNRRFTDMTEMKFSSLLGEVDVVKAMLRRAETRANQVRLLMSLRAEFLINIHNVGDEQPFRAVYECEIEDVERQLASFHEQLSTEPQPDVYISLMLMECDVDSMFYTISQVIDPPFGF